jgi:hypothetical protein
MAVIQSHRKLGPFKSDTRGPTPLRVSKGEDIDSCTHPSSWRPQVSTRRGPYMNARPMACLARPDPFKSANKSTFWSKTYANLLVSGPVSHVPVLTALLERPLPASHGGSQPCLVLSYSMELHFHLLKLPQVSVSKHPFGTLQV